MHTDLTFKHYLIIELIEACKTSSHLDLDDLINVNNISKLFECFFEINFYFVKKLMGFFGCESDEDKLNFLKVLLIFEKLEDILKEATIETVNSINNNLGLK